MTQASKSLSLGGGNFANKIIFDNLITAMLCVQTYSFTNYGENLL